MNALARAEWLRIRSTPTYWWLLLGTVAIGVLGTLAPLIAAKDNSASALLTEQRLREAMHGAAAGSMLVVVAGIIGMAGEWRFGQVTQAFLTTPKRRRVMTTKLFSHVVLGAVFGLVAAIATLATAWIWYRSEGVALPIGRTAVWLTLLGCVAVAMMFGALGIAVGAITRNPVTGIVGALVWLVIVEQTLFAASRSVFRWLPGMASMSLRRQPADGLLAMAPAAFVLATAISALLLAGLWFVERDDVTG